MGNGGMPDRFTMFALAGSIVALVLGLAASHATAQAPTTDVVTAQDLLPTEEQAAQVAATVNGEPITVGEVARLLATSLGKRKIAAEALPRLQAEALEQVIDQRLVAQYLRQHGQGISDEELEVAFNQFRQSLELQKRPFDEHLKRERLTEQQLKQQLYWTLSWRRYTARHITDEILQRRFERDRKHYDGSEVRVAHLLLKPQPGQTLDDALPELTRKAQTLRDQIERGELTFDDAVARYSDGTKENGGDLGFITSPGSMPEPFTKAAFSLEVGQVSPPVTTPFGVHLIRCTEVKPGTRTLDDVRRQVQRDVMQDGLERLAQQARQSANITYSGAWPHFRPGTQELAGVQP